MNVIVVRGGPAGAVAAITARQAGMAVTLLEVARGPRFRPGETLHPAVEPILDQLNARAALDAECLRHSGTWVQWGGPSEFVSFGADDVGTWQGFQPPRPDFDHQLLKTALALGVEVREGTPALGGQLKAGNLWTGQNRQLPARPRPVSSTSFPRPCANRSALWCASSEARI